MIATSAVILHLLAVTRSGGLARRVHMMTATPVVVVRLLVQSGGHVLRALPVISAGAAAAITAPSCVVQYRLPHLQLHPVIPLPTIVVAVAATEITTPTAVALTAEVPVAAAAVVDSLTLLGPTEVAVVVATLEGRISVALPALLIAGLPLAVVVAVALVVTTELIAGQTVEGAALMAAVAAVIVVDPGLGAMGAPLLAPRLRRQREIERVRRLHHRAAISVAAAAATYLRRFRTLAAYLLVRQTGQIHKSDREMVRVALAELTQAAAVLILAPAATAAPLPLPCSPSLIRLHAASPPHPQRHPYPHRARTCEAV